MVIPSFGEFAPAPDLAGSYLGGIASAQKAQQILQEGAHAGAAIQMQQQKLQQDAQEAAMANQIQQQRLQQDHLRSQQELAIKSQYEQQMIDFHKDQLAQQGQLVQMKTQEAAHKFAAQQQFQSRVDQGEDPNDVMRELGPMLGVTGAGMASMFRPQPPALGSKIAGPDGMSMVVTGNNQAQPYMPASMQQDEEQDMGTADGESAGVHDTTTGTSQAQLPTAMTPSLIQADTARKSVTQRATQASKALAQREAEADKREKLSLIGHLQEQNQKDYDGSEYYAKLVKGDKINAEQEKTAKRYSDRLDLIERLNSELAGGAARNSQSPAKSELGAGEAIHTLKNGRKAVFKDKEFVRYAD